MSSISRFKSKAFLVTLLVFAGIEAVVRLVPAEYGAGAGIFLTNHRRKLAESSLPEFDYIILGDSRSLSLMGHPPTEEEPYSIYNFSMPAMGPRYFKYFLEKYLENRKHPPAAVIFAADPETFSRGWMRPYHDPGMVYSDGLNESLAEYLEKRVVRRIELIFNNKKSSRRGDGGVNSMVWDYFSHRYLHLFSIPELSRQFTGPERIFIFREAIPLLYQTYKYRDAIGSVTFGMNSNTFHFREIPAVCSTCDGVLREECHRPLSNLQDNLLLAEGLKERYGQINLGDRLTPEQRLQFLMAKKSQIQGQKEAFNRETPDLTYLEDFVRYATSKGIRVLITDMPAIDAYQDTKYHREYFPMVRQMLKKYPLAEMVRFPRPYYPEDLFVEQVHYDCPGAARLNHDFFESVVPSLLRFAPPDPSPARKATRGFVSLSPEHGLHPEPHK